MEAKAITKFVRMSAFKGRDVTRHIQGMPAAQAMERLRFWPKKAAALVAKTLHSAMANAENNHGMRPEALFVKEAVIGEGPTIKRFQPKARGSAGPILKRTSHIRIVLIEKQQEAKPAKAAKKPRAAKSESASKKEKASTEQAPETKE